MTPTSFRGNCRKRWPACPGERSWLWVIRSIPPWRTYFASSSQYVQIPSNDPKPRRIENLVRDKLKLREADFDPDGNAQVGRFMLWMPVGFGGPIARRAGKDQGGQQSREPRWRRPSRRRASIFARGATPETGHDETSGGKTREGQVLHQSERVGPFRLAGLSVQERGRAP